MPKSFVYVYDMPSRFNTDILDLPTIWHPEQYDIDQVPPLRCTLLLVTCQHCATCQRANGCAHALGDLAAKPPVRRLLSGVEANHDGELVWVSQVLHKHLTKSPVNTQDGEEAKVFYIPVFLGRYFNAAWQKYSDPSDAWIINKECHGLDEVECWAEKWKVAENVRASSGLHAFWRIRTARQALYAA